MAVTEDVARLVLETIGAEGVEDLRKKIAALPAEMGELTAAFGRGEIELKDYDEQAKRLSATHKQLSSALDELDKKSGKATNKLQGLGQAGLQSGRVIQDFAQGGIGGILNNIEGFTQAVGGGPGLAGVLTGLGVALFIAKPFVAEFIDSLRTGDVDTFTGSLQKMKERIDEITKNPIKLLTDLSELDAAKAALKGLEEGEKALQAAKEGKSVQEKEAGDEIKKVLTDRGDVLAKAVKDITQVLVAERAASPAIRQATKELKEAREGLAQAEASFTDRNASPEEKMGAGAAIAVRQANVKRAEDALSAAAAENRLKAERDLGALLKGAQAGNNPAAQADLVGRLRQVGQGDLAKQIEGITPQEIDKKAKRKAKAEDDKEQADTAREVDAAAKEVADAQKKAVKEGLEPILKAGDLKANVAAAIKEAEDLFAGMTPEKRYAEVKALVLEELKRRLAAAGVGKTGDSTDLLSAAATQLLGQGGLVNAKGERAAAAADKKVDKKEMADQVKAADAYHKAVAEQAKAFSGLQADAQLAIAQHIGRGGRVGPQGQLGEKAAQELKANLARVIHQQNPGMNKWDAFNVAGQIGINAQKETSDQMAAMAGRVQGSQAVAQQLIARAQGAIAKLDGRMLQIEATNQRLLQNQQRLENQVRRPGPSNLSLGRP